MVVMGRWGSGFSAGKEKWEGKGYILGVGLTWVV